MARHAHACPKCAGKRNFQYLGNGLSFGYDFRYVNKVPSELHINCHILGHACLGNHGMPKVCQSKENSQLLQWVELFSKKSKLDKKCFCLMLLLLFVNESIDFR